MTAFRILVGDVTRALRFYRDHLGFQIVEQFGSAMAILERDGVRIWLSGPQTSAAKPTADGEQPGPGGWNRLVIQVEDLDALLVPLIEAGYELRNEPVTGPGGKQALIRDGEGNLVEIFAQRGER
ncbi:MAG TPA: VOC family protein [Fimbriimonadaceae bacterium]|nr:VOC family protein [Fimbriimonadaceae bacterium]